MSFFIFLQVGLIILFLIFQVTLGARREHTQETIKPITFSFLILQITLSARGEHTLRGYQFSFLEIFLFFFFFLEIGYLISLPQQRRQNVWSI